MKKIGTKGWIAIGVIAVILIAWFSLRGGKNEEKVSFEMAKVENGKIQTSITATGTIEPVTSVTVGTQVSGIVSHLYVDYNSVVKKGQVIAELDRTNLISELNTAKANLTSAQSTANYEQSNYNRYKTLYEKGLVSADEFENAQLSYQKAREQVNTSRESVRKAQTNLGYATITSPIDGVILSKSVEEGQTVATDGGCLVQYPGALRHRQGLDGYACDSRYRRGRHRGRDGRPACQLHRRCLPRRYFRGSCDAGATGGYY